MTRQHTQASDIVDLTVELHYETSPGEENEGAILVSDDGNKAKAVWLPKSLVEIDERRGRTIEIQVPERIAAEKGLI